MLQGDEARFRWLLDLLHSAKSRPEILALYRHLKPEDLPPSLRRLFQLWAYREEKMKSSQTYLREIERAKVWLVEQAQSGAAAEQGSSEQDSELARVSRRRERALAAYEASEAQLEEQVRNLQQTAESKSKRSPNSRQQRPRSQTLDTVAAK